MRAFARLFAPDSTASDAALAIAPSRATPLQRNGGARAQPRHRECPTRVNELDGWKMVAEQAQQMQARRESELQTANRTINALREDKENSRGK